jgi:hypothetical protein
MAKHDVLKLKDRIDRIRTLSSDGLDYPQWFEAASLCQSVLLDTVGKGHPLMGTLEGTLQHSDWQRLVGAIKAVLTLFDQGALVSPRLEIAHEIEGDLLDIAQKQVQDAEKDQDPTKKQVRLAIAAFLAGAALEDGLRRLCDANGAVYDPQQTSIAKLQTALYQPSKQIEIISKSENSQISGWGQTRNKADHGKFAEITLSEVLAAVIGVRGFLDKHLP